MLPKKNATISTIFNPSTISWFTQLVAGRSLKKTHGFTSLSRSWLLRPQAVSE
jgi:hypothetical protein